MNTISAQISADFCATPEDHSSDPLGQHSYDTSRSRMMNEDEVKVLNVYYWQINGPNGENPNPISQNIVLESIVLLNHTYNPMNIFFKYRGYEAINSPDDVILEDLNNSCFPVEENGMTVIDQNGFGILSRCQLPEFWDYTGASAEHEDAINIYIPYLTEGFAGAAKFIGENQIVVPTSNICNSILIHEMGHALGLSHTHAGFSSNSGCERVTRDPNDVAYNATTAGDKVADTAAVPNFIREYCFFDDPTATCNSSTGLSKFYIDEDNCIYTGQNTDCDGDFYQIATEDVRNYMSYSERDCFDYFSPGQAIRMQERIDSDPDLIAATTDIASLYEPYVGEYYLGGPITLSMIPRLQPGFDYFFQECEGSYPQPAVYEDTSFGNGIRTYEISKFEDDYASIEHTNGWSFRIVHPSLGNEQRKCYNNFNRSPRGGTITRFNDNTFNQNVTVTAQDSLQINNEQTIEQLQPGLYKIEKNYGDGTTEEQIISKSNNE